MKFRVILLFLVCLSANSNAQVNNIPNWSFENPSSCTEFTRCGSSLVIDWYSPTDATPDRIVPTCPNNLGMPQNYVGYQYPRTGESYAGLAFYADPFVPNYREYITGTLVKKLDTNKEYCVEFFVNLADSFYWASSAIGAYFSSDSICFPSSNTLLPYIPQVENPLTNFITDRIDWVSISQEFQASGGEQFITIGNFYSSKSYFDSIGNTSTWDSPYPSTYYYVDDVSVRELTIANAAISVNGKKIDTICPFNGVQIGRDTITPGVSFYWSPNYNLSNPNIAQPWASPSVTTTYTLTVVNDSVHGCNCADSVTRDSVTIVVNLCTGINNLRLRNYDLKINPNPNNGIFLISGLEKNMQVEIYNCIGQLVYLQSNIQNPTSNIDLQSKTDGVYLIRVTENGWLVGQRKVIVNR